MYLNPRPAGVFSRTRPAGGGGAEFQVEVKSSQVKIGQIFKLVFSNKIGVYLIQFLTVNSTAVFFIFVDGLQLPKIAIKKFDA